MNLPALPFLPELKEDRAETELVEVLSGLRSRPRYILPKYFYDEWGSNLFLQICQLPEYYLTRCETAVLHEHGAAIAAAIGPGAFLIELGSGESQKISCIAAHLPSPRAYMAVDISLKHLVRGVESFSQRHQSLEAIGVHADYLKTSAFLDRQEYGSNKVICFLGSTLGNMTPGEAMVFLKKMAARVGAGGKLLLGVDLQKDVSVLEAAYNDAQGVTAAFNLNALARLNRDFDADFDLSGFEHHAFYHADQHRIEMHLRSQRRQTVHVAGERFEFFPDDDLHTENSYKYTLDSLQRLARFSGWRSLRAWTDAAHFFSVHLLERQDGRKIEH